MWFTKWLSRPDPEGSSAREHAGARAAAARRSRGRLRGVLRSRRGAYAVEFAFLTPIFIPVLMGTIEVCWQFGASIALDNAAAEASRFGSLGRKNPDGTRNGSSCPAAIKEAAVKAGGGILASNRLTMTATQYGNAAGLRTRTGGTSGTGVGGSFVEYRLEYRQPLLFSGDWFLFRKAEMTHVAVTTVLNEPYPNATNTASC